MAQKIESARKEREHRRQLALRHAEESTVGKKVLDYFKLSQTVHDEDAAARENEAVLKRSEEGKRLRAVLYARACQLALDQLEAKASRFPPASIFLPPPSPFERSHLTDRAFLSLLRFTFDVVGRPSATCCARP